ncbi:PPOX class F420-dependent oxidoreductase [Kribbella endophytica]
MSFTAEELAYLKSQPLARLATVDGDGQPDVVPVGLEYDGTYFYIGGHDPARTRKVLNVRNGYDRIAFVVDDLVSRDPWSPRFVRVYGTAEVIEREGQFGAGTYLRITPTVSWSWHLDGRAVEAAPYAPLRTDHRKDA